MTRRRALKGILNSFLATYTSRYSDYDGYWLFGMLVEDLGKLKIDLLGETTNTASPMTAAAEVAERKFKEQLAKAGFNRSYLREAQLTITKSDNPTSGIVNGRWCAGHEVRFVAKVTTDLGRVYEARLSVFVAPHDPGIELRSASGA